MKFGYRLLLLIGLAAAPLAAEGPSFGLQAGVVTPQGSYFRNEGNPPVNGKIGYSLGLNSNFRPAGDWDIRAHLNYLSFPQVTRVTPVAGVVPDTEHNKVSAYSLGGDAVYFFDSTRRGLYTLAGLSVQAWKSEYDYTATEYSGSTMISTHQIGTSHTDPAISLQLGFGWQFNKQFSTELEYNLIKAHTPSPAQPAGNSSQYGNGNGSTANTLGLSLLWYF